MTQERDEELLSEEEPTEVDFEPEEEFGSLGALKQKLALLKDELVQVKKERAEYLDGWQRCKADGVNARRDSLVSLETARQRAQEALIEEMIPVMDSFDMAMQGSGWQLVEGTWRVGVENIANQLVRALEAGGAEYFGKTGETFNHEYHHAVAETDDEGDPHTIARVIRRGWKLKNRVIRPAEVIVFKERLDSL